MTKQTDAGAVIPFHDWFRDKNLDFPGVSSMKVPTSCKNGNGNGDRLLRMKSLGHIIKNYASCVLALDL